VTHIPAGTYTLKEIASPDGYVIATEIKFTIDIYNNMTVDNVDAGSVDSDGKPTISMVDDTTKVELHKLAVIYQPTNIMPFTEFNTDPNAIEVYELLIKMGFTADEIEQVYNDAAAGLVDEDYIGELIEGRPFDLADIAELLKMKEDGRLRKLFDKFKEYEEYVAKATDENAVPEELVGAVMQVLDPEGNIVDEWTSTSEAHILEAVLVAGHTYTLHEVSAPTGYVLADDVTFTVSDNGTVDKVYLSDDVTKVTVTKYDITGEKEIAGAKLQVLDSEGNIVDEWFSGENAHEINGVLEAGGTYTLHEELAPDGYIVASDVTFTVDEKGEVTKVAMYDDTTKVKISKRDITTNEELPGATLQIIDKDGNVVEEWVSTSETHYIEAVLIAGESYKLHETIAPDGYEVANDVDFTVNADGTVTEVVMYDEKKPETPDTPDTPDSPSTPSSPSNPSSPSSPSTPNPSTGSGSGMMNGSFAMMAVAGSVMIAAKRKRED
ncbi:MAG: NPXTG-anchored protein, partial [Ruminococcus sp.]|nr:NPXTG-anchored protein [Ruminococcus sp.]